MVNVDSKLNRHRDGGLKTFELTEDVSVFLKSVMSDYAGYIEDIQVYINVNVWLDKNHPYLPNDMIISEFDPYTGHLEIRFNQEYFKDSKLLTGYVC